MKALYPEIEPYHSFFMKTDSQHEVYVELSGKPDGIPVIFLHGGPCSGTKPDHRRFFNPDRYRIILFDQRGCGRSLPFGEWGKNTTQDLIDDIERIRAHLGVRQWLVFGGSWGGALALLYAQQHQHAVSGLVIRAVFLARQRDLDWFGELGAGRIYPQLWQALLETLPEGHRENFVEGLWSVLWGGDELARRRAARAWMAWGAQVALGHLFQPGRLELHVTEEMVKQAKMELHYARHRYFVTENQILEQCPLLKAVPAVIIHGRHDLLCPMEAGWALHQAMPHADYVVLPNAGHIAQHEEMVDALVAATDSYASQWGRMD